MFIILWSIIRNTIIPRYPHLCILWTISGICSTDEIEWNRNGDGVIDFYPLHFLFPASKKINPFFVSVVFWNITKKTRLMIDLVLQSVNDFDCHMHISILALTCKLCFHVLLIRIRILSHHFLLSCQSHWVSLS